jgi:xanthine dehydrogenase accessory factor
MLDWINPFLARLANEPAVLVSVHEVQGSAPREAGAWMAVFADGQVNTLGGGHLEFEATSAARQMLQAQAPTGAMPTTLPRDQILRYALGPSLGQCCGGIVHLKFECVTPHNQLELATRLARPGITVALFGGGHVGQALVRVLADLPFEVMWVDSREAIFPNPAPTHVRVEHSEPVQAAVNDVPAGSAILIMSFSHAEDLEILAACLQRARQLNDLPFIGLIGSKTKWATFRHRLESRGYTAQDFDRVTCPIGIAGIEGKQAEVIAVSVAAQLLQHFPQAAAAS